MQIGSRRRQAYRQEGYLVVRRLISGDEFREFDRMTDRLLDGDLQPELAYQGWTPDHFYTFWEPGMEDRTDLPRRDRRLMANMYHHYPYLRALGSHPRSTTWLHRSMRPACGFSPIPILQTASDLIKIERRLSVE